MTGTDRVVGEKTSVLLQAVLDNLPETEVTVDDILVRLRRRSFGGLLILLAALGLIPGISVLAGLAMIIPGLQMAVGFTSPHLPRFVGERKIQTRRLQQLGRRGVRVVQWFERFALPRALFMTAPLMMAFIGLLITALALFCLALGILERDGLLVGFGLFLGAIALTIGVVVAHVAIESVMPALMRYFQ